MEKLFTKFEIMTNGVIWISKLNLEWKQFHYILVDCTYEKTKWIGNQWSTNFAALPSRIQNHASCSCTQRRTGKLLNKRKVKIFGKFYQQYWKHSELTVVVLGLNNLKSNRGFFLFLTYKYYCTRNS